MWSRNFYFWHRHLMAKIFAVVIFCSSSYLSATTISLDVEGFSDSTILTTQYPGLTFTNAIVLSSGVSLNEFEFSPHSGFHGMSHSNGPLTIQFAAPITSFSAYFTYLEPLALAGFDDLNLEVANTTSAFSTNDALFGDVGSLPNEVLRISSAIGISSVTITGDRAGGSFVMDDASYVSAGSTVPEPSSGVLFLTGSVIFAMFRRGWK